MVFAFCVLGFLFGYFGRWLGLPFWVIILMAMILAFVGAWYLESKERS